MVLEQVAPRLRGTASAEHPLIRLGAPLEYFYEMALERLVGAAFRCWVQFGETRHLLERLEHDELDLVIATQRLSTQAIDYVKIAEERFILVGSPDKIPPTAGADMPERQAQIESWLKAQHWISYGAELPIIRRFWQQSFNRRPEIQPALVIPDLRAIAKAVELGWGISVLPDYLCRAALAAERLRVIWEAPQPVVNELWLAYRQINRNDAAIQHIQVLLQATKSRNALQERRA